MVISYICKYLRGEAGKDGYRPSQNGQICFIRLKRWRRFPEQNLPAPAGTEKSGIWVVMEDSGEISHCRKHWFHGFVNHGIAKYLHKPVGVHTDQALPTRTGETGKMQVQPEPPTKHFKNVFADIT